MCSITLIAPVIIMTKKLVSDVFCPVVVMLLPPSWVILQAGLGKSVVEPLKGIKKQQQLLQDVCASHTQLHVWFCRNDDCKQSYGDD